MSHQVTIYESFEALRADADDYLMQHEHRLAMIHRVLRRFSEGFGAFINTPNNHCLAIRTPPWNLLVGDLREAQCSGLIDSVLSHDPQLPSVLAPSESALVFARAWAARTGATMTKKHSMRLLAASTVQCPKLHDSEAIIKAQPKHREQLIGWLKLFNEATGMTSHGQDAETVDKHLENQHAYILEANGEPQGCAVISDASEHGAFVGFVFTPSDKRRQGVASRLVGGITKIKLRELNERGGRREGFVSLFTDANNPTSNRIYEALGYEHVCDYTTYAFEYMS